MKQKPAEAAEHYQRAIGIEPTETEAWQLLAECRVAARDHSARRQIELVKDIAKIVAELPEKERKEKARGNGEQAVKWIDEQLDFLLEERDGNGK
jgi:hypothetical protein